MMATDLTKATDTNNATSTSVLIVDDDAIFRMDLREMLEAMGYLVVGEARDGRNAIALTRKLRPDLVIMDVRLPGEIDGIHTARALADDHSAAVLLLTGFSDSDLAQRAAEAGATGYLLKPFREDVLRPTVEIALARAKQIRLLHQEVTELREELDARQVLERARDTLMEEHHLTEDEAMTRIRKASTTSGKPIREVAEAIILAQQVDSQRE